MLKRLANTLISHFKMSDQFEKGSNVMINKIDGQLPTHEYGYLVSTSIGLFWVFPDNKTVKKIWGDLYCYGIAENKDGFIVLARELDRSCTALFFNKNLKLVNEKRIHEAQDVHECELVNRKLYITDCIHHDIVSFDIDTGNIKREEWLGIFGHPNTITFHDQKFYILDLTANTIIVADYKGNILFKANNFGDGCHTLKFYDDKMYVCNANAVTVSVFDSELNQIDSFKIGSRDKWHCRGFMFDGEIFYVGLSTQSERSQRKFGDGRVRMFNSEYDMVGEVPLPNAGQVNEIIPLKEKPNNEWSADT